MLLLLSLRRRFDDFLGDVGRQFVVVGELHAIDAGAAGHRAQVRGIGLKLRHGHVGVDDLVFARVLHAQHPAAADKRLKAGFISEINQSVFLFVRR
jgi:hypothetical protein